MSWTKIKKVEFAGSPDEEYVPIKCQCGREINVSPYPLIPGVCSKCGNEYYFKRNIQVFIKGKQ